MGNYSDVYQLEYYDGYGYNFYSQKYGYYEYSCAPVVGGGYSIATLIINAVILIVISIVSAVYYNNTKNNVVLMACYFPWILTGLLGVAIVAPFAIVGGILWGLGVGCVVCLDKCAIIAGNVTIDLSPEAPQEINYNVNITNT